ncbi:MAG: class I SAM-dependent methyltransferase [Patescibacteria group bacterium]
MNSMKNLSVKLDGLSTVPTRYFSYYLLNRPLFLSLIRTKEIELLRKYARLKGKTLDFGCGDGFFMRSLMKFAPNIFKESQIIGVDVICHSRESGNPWIPGISPRSGPFGASLNPRMTDGVYNKLIKYDGITLPFKDNSFDTVFSNCVFEHLPYLEKNLQEMHRVLKPNGRLITTVMAEPWNRYNLLPSAFWRKVQIHLNLLTHSQWSKLFQKNGFRVVRKVGYLNKTQSRIIELSHFLSVPYLISYKLFGRWDTFGGLYNALVPKKLITTIFSHQPKLSESAAIYFELEKN